MNSKTKIVFAIGAIGTVVFLAANQVLAHEADTASSTPGDTTTSNGVDLATTQEISDNELGQKPGFFKSFQLKISRAFTKDDLKGVKIDNELARMALRKARLLANTGKTDEAVKALDQYNAQMAAIQNKIDALAQTLTAKNPELKDFMARVADQQMLAASAIDKVEHGVGGANKKLVQAQLEAIKRAAHIVEKTSDDPAKRAEELNKLAERFANKTAKATEQIEHENKALDALEQAGDDDIFAEALDKAKDKIADKIAKSGKIGDIIKDLENPQEKHIKILQSVLEKAPDAAKPAIQKAIDDSLGRLAKKAENNPGVVDEALGRETMKVGLKQREELLKKIKEKSGEKVKQAIEKKEEKIKNLREKEDGLRKKREELRLKAQEKKIEQDKKTEEKKQELKREVEKKTETRAVSPTTAANPTPTLTPPASDSASGSSESTESKTYEVKYKNARFDTSNAPSAGINGGDSIKFKNDGDQTIQINSDDHPTHLLNSELNVGTLAKGQEKTVKLTKKGTWGIHNHLSTLETGTIIVK